MRNLMFSKTIATFFLLFTLSITISTAQTNEVVIVDSNFNNIGGLIASLPVGLPYVTVTDQDSFQQVLDQAMDLAPSAQIIHLFAPTDTNSIAIGNKSYSAEMVKNGLDSALFSGRGTTTLLVYSCSLAKNSEGVELLESIASKTNFNVASCASCETLDNKLNFDFSTQPLQITSTLFE